MYNKLYHNVRGVLEYKTILPCVLVLRISCLWLHTYKAKDIGPYQSEPGLGYLTYRHIFDHYWSL